MGGGSVEQGAGVADPGWGKPLRRFLPFVLMPALLTKRRGDGEPEILVLRTAFLAFVAALLGFLTVILVLFPVTTDGPIDPLVYALVGAGPFTLTAIPWARRRLLDACAPPAELAANYRTSVFLAIAFVESAALFAFVATFLAGVAWPYLVGMSVSLVGFAAIAPTTGRVRSLDEDLTRRGCQHSLRAALFAPGVAGPGADDGPGA